MRRRIVEDGMGVKALKMSQERQDGLLLRLSDFQEGQFHFGSHPLMHEEEMPLGASVDVEFKITAC